MTERQVALARPALGAEELAAVERVLRSGRLVQGPEVEAFERELAARAGVDHAVAVSSGTAALHLALWVLGVGPGDEVVVPALTFPAPAAAALALGARPVLADVEPASWNLSVAAARAALSERTRAIVAVDQFGVPGELVDLEQLALEAGVALVEDAACSLGGHLGGRPCGSFGRLATTSFHPRKVVTTGEGGALMTASAELASRARSLRDHGRRDGRFEEAGLNLRLGEVPAAIGRTQLARLDDLLSRRRLLARRYLGALSDPTRLGGLGLRPQRAGDAASPTYQTFAVLLGEAEARAEVIEALAREGIEASVASFSLGRLAPFNAAGLRPEDLPVAEAVHGRGLALPLHPAMTESDVDRVLEALAGALSHPSGGRAR